MPSGKENEAVLFMRNVSDFGCSLLTLVGSGVTISVPGRVHGGLESGIVKVAMNTRSKTSEFVHHHPVVGFFDRCGTQVAAVNRNSHELG